MGVHPGVHRLAAIVGAGDGAAGVRRVGRRRVNAARRRCGDRPARAFQVCGCARCWPGCCPRRFAANGVSAGVSSALSGNRYAGFRSASERRHQRFSTPRPLRLIGFDPKESWHPTTNAGAPCAPPHARPASRKFSRCLAATDACHRSTRSTKLQIAHKKIHFVTAILIAQNLYMQMAWARKRWENIGCLQIFFFVAPL